MGNARSQLAERCHLLGLDQIGLRCLEVAQRAFRRVSRGANLAEQPRAFHRNHRLRRKILQQRDLLVGKRPRLLTVDVKDAE